jgi:cyclopropane fatty-acyl-phospholipid synthase-like methyltransferase
LPVNQSMYTDDYFERNIEENQYLWRGELRPDQIAAIEYANRGRKPVRVLSIGCGRGFVEHTLANCGADVTAIECADNRKFDNFRLILGGMDTIPDEDFDTVMFIESIEHIEEEEFERNWPRLVAMLIRTGGRLVIVNWETLHPIPLNGWDHVRVIDDALYDRLSLPAARVVHRSGSHLVLDF